VSTAGAGDALLAGVLSAFAVGIHLICPGPPRRSICDRPVASALDFGTLLACHLSPYDSPRGKAGNTSRVCRRVGCEILRRHGTSFLIVHIRKRGRHERTLRPGPRNLPSGSTTATGFGTLGPDLLRDCAHSAYRTRSVVWGSGEPLQRPLRHHHSDRNVRDDDHCTQLRPDGGGLSFGGLGLHLCRQRVEPLRGLFRRVGDATGLSAPAAD
jgi:hypothetical protein